MFYNLEPVILPPSAQLSMDTAQLALGFRSNDLRSEDILHS